MTDREQSNLSFTLWDTPFVDKFASITLPTIMSPGNLPSIARTQQIRVLIYTNRESVEYLRVRTAPLADFAEVMIFPFEDTVVDGLTIEESIAGFSGPSLKHELERRSIFHAIDETLAQGDGTPLFLIPADMVMSDGSLSHAQAALDNGAEAVAPPVLRISAAAAEISAGLLSSGTDALSICQTLPGSFHHITGNCIATSDTFTNYPTAILWPVSMEGFVCRSFFPLTLAFKPRSSCRRFYSTIDYDYLLNLVDDPEDIYIPESSEEVFVCKASDDSYMSQTGAPRRLTLSRYVHFILTETNKAHRALVSRPYKIYKRSGNELTIEDWIKTEAESGDFIDGAYKSLSESIKELPKDTPGLAQSVASHFGPLEDFLSPMRQAARPT